MLEALQRRAQQFRPREELWPLRVPREPVLLGDVVEEALPDDHRGFDAMTLRSRTLLQLTWNDGSVWEAWVVALPSRLKLYCDTGEDETRILASGGRNEGEESDRAFLGLLAESAGEHFGIEMSGGAPSRVRCAIADRAFLAELFINLFEVTGAEESVRVRVTDAPPAPVSQRDFRSDVERWLDLVLQK